MLDIPVYIYEITDGIMFYVGKSVNPKKRLRQHLYTGQHPEIYGKPTPCDQFLAEFVGEENLDDLLDRGILHLGIVEAANLNNWSEREKFWITWYREHYGRDYVLNVTDGGEDNLGESNPNAKLTWDEVNFIRELNLSPLLIKKYLGISKTQARRIRSNTAWYDPAYEPVHLSNIQESNFKAQTTPESRLAMYQLRYDFKDGFSIQELAESYFPHLKQKSAEKKVRAILRGEQYPDPDWDPEVEYPGRQSTRKHNRTVKEKF